jgi:hypothetical protein
VRLQTPSFIFILLSKKCQQAFLAVLTSVILINTNRVTNERFKCQEVQESVSKEQRTATERKSVEREGPSASPYMVLGGTSCQLVWLEPSILLIHPMLPCLSYLYLERKIGEPGFPHQTSITGSFLRGDSVPAVHILCFVRGVHYFGCASFCGTHGQYVHLWLCTSHQGDCFIRWAFTLTLLRKGKIGPVRLIILYLGFVPSWAVLERDRS